MTCCNFVVSHVRLKLLPAYFCRCRLGWMATLWIQYPTNPTRYSWNKLDGLWGYALSFWWIVETSSSRLDVESRISSNHHQSNGTMDTGFDRNFAAVLVPRCPQSQRLGETVSSSSILRTRCCHPAHHAPQMPMPIKTESRWWNWCRTHLFDTR